MNSSSILWVDCTAAATVGALVLALSPWLSSLYGLPLPFLWFLGAVNLTYGCQSFSLAARPRRGPRSLHVLIVGNGLWAAPTSANYLMAKSIRYAYDTHPNKKADRPHEESAGSGL